MDGEERFDIFIPLAVRIHQRVINWRQSALPIIAVDDVGVKIDIRQHFKHCTGEKSETLCVIVMAVDRIPLEIILVIEQVVGNAVGLGLKYAAVLPAPRHGYRQACDKMHIITHLLRDRGIQWQHDAAADQPPTQRLGKTPCNIAQTAAGDKGERLARNI